MRNLYFLLCVALFFGCSKGPDKVTLKKEIQEKLDKRFKKELFKIEDFSRRGSYSFKEEGNPNLRLLVYYKAQIRFLQDYKLSEWEGANVGSLVAILGATSLGIQGIKPDGNKKEDVFLVYGTSSYEKQENKWIAVNSSPKKQQQDNKDLKSKYLFEDDEAEKQEERDLPLYSQHLLELKKMAKSFNKKKEKENLAFLQKELKQLIKRTQFQAGKSRGLLTLATSSPLGEYDALGRGLQRVSKEIKSYNTSGSIENCTLINNKNVLFAMVQNDIVAMAYNGTNIFEKKAFSDLRALCSLYPEAVHIIVGKKSNIKKIEDLAGKKINIGVKGSGARINALQILKAYKLDVSKFAEVKENSPDIAASELQKGTIHAMFITSAYPTRIVNNLAAKYPIRLLSIDPEIANTFAAKKTFIPLKIGKSTYVGLEGDITTLGVTAMIVTHKDTKEQAATNFLQKLFQNVAKISQESLQAHYISPKKAIVGASIPFHVAAQKYFKLQKNKK